jgi:hypothetical protein
LLGTTLDPGEVPEILRLARNEGSSEMGISKAVTAPQSMNDRFQASPLNSSDFALAGSVSP